jgi:hypothetical protein
VDAVAMLMAGADAVEVGTATFRDPRAPARVLSGLTRWCRRNGVRDVRSLVSAVHRKPAIHAEPHEMQRFAHAQSLVLEPEHEVQGEDT